MDFDIDGAARDLEDRARRWSKWFARHPGAWECYQLLTRNPWAAEKAAEAIRKIVEEG